MREELRYRCARISPSLAGLKPRGGCRLPPPPLVSAPPSDPLPPLPAVVLFQIIVGQYFSAARVASAPFAASAVVVAGDEDEDAEPGKDPTPNHCTSSRTVR